MAVAAGVVGLAACGGAAVEQAAGSGAGPVAPSTTPAEAPGGAAPGAQLGGPDVGTPDVVGPDADPPLPTRPAWLGTRPLPLRPDGYGEMQPTPAELVNRALPTVDLLPPPADERFVATVGTVPEQVAGRSTWDPACPVGLDDLRYVTVSFWGFDGRPHTGELLLHASVADDVVEVFRRLHQERFPIEEMRITTSDELDAHPTGDGNNTGAFVCRPSRGTTSWSEHAYGRAVDINPFHNPYLKGDVVLPELASAYADRAASRPGMILRGDVVASAFEAAGWGWGGDWRSSKDYMHFSVNGR